MYIIQQAAFLIRYPYYHCCNNQCGEHGNYPLEKVHEEFFSFLEDQSPTPALLERVRKYLQETAAAYTNNIVALEHKRTIEAGRVRQLQEQLIRMKMEQMISDEEFMAHRGELASRLTETLALGAESEAVVDDVLNSFDTISDKLRHLGELWKNLPRENRRWFQRLLLPDGYVHGSVGTARRGRLFSVFSTYQGPKSDWVPLAGDSWNPLAKDLREFAAICANDSSIRIDV